MTLRNLAASLGALALFAGAALAEEYTNSVSGPVTRIDANTIEMTQGKGKEKYVIRRNRDSKVDAGLKVGDVVKVEYYMTAATAGLKGDAPAKAPKVAKPAAPVATPAAPAPTPAASPAKKPKKPKQDPSATATPTPASKTP